MATIVTRSGKGSALTHAQMDANLTSLNDDKAETSNVLTRDNTSPFTPNNDYEPATKKYVDDNKGRDVATANEIRTGTNNEKVVTPQGIYDTIFGMGQTLQDLTSERSQEADFINTTGRTITAFITLEMSGGINQASINGTIVSRMGVTAGVNATLTHTLIIPNSATYRIDGAGTYQSWFEIR